MYNPTEEEMKEMGFIITENGVFHKDVWMEIIQWADWRSVYYMSHGSEEDDDYNLIKAFPESRQDIENLIRLFTPPSLNG